MVLPPSYIRLCPSCGNFYIYHRAKVLDPKGEGWWYMDNMIGTKHEEFIWAAVAACNNPELMQTYKDYVDAVKAGHFKDED